MYPVKQQKIHLVSAAVLTDVMGEPAMKKEGAV